MTAADIGELFDDALTFVGVCDMRGPVELSGGPEPNHFPPPPRAPMIVSAPGHRTVGTVEAMRVAGAVGMRGSRVAPRRAFAMLSTGYATPSDIEKPTEGKWPWISYTYQLVPPGIGSVYTRAIESGGDGLDRWRMSETVGWYSSNGNGWYSYAEADCIAGRWSMTVVDPSKDYIGKDISDLAHGRLLAIEAQSLFWSVDLSMGGGASAVRLLTDPLGAREVFALRDMPNGKSRRAAIRHWVKSHYRQSRVDPESRSYVAKHLRGVSRFNWNGLGCTIRPAFSELEQLAKDSGRALSEVLV